MKLQSTTIGTLIAELQQVKAELGEDARVSVHGCESVDVRVYEHAVALVGFDMPREVPS